MMMWYDGFCDLLILLFWFLSTMWCVSLLRGDSCDVLPSLVTACTQYRFLPMPENAAFSAYFLRGLFCCLCLYAFFSSARGYNRAAERAVPCPSVCRLLRWHGFPSAALCLLVLYCCTAARWRRWLVCYICSCYYIITALHSLIYSAYILPFYVGGADGILVILERDIFYGGTVPWRWRILWNGIHSVPASDAVLFIRWRVVEVQ